MSNPPPPYAAGELKDGILVVTVLAQELRDVDLAYALRDEIAALVDSSQARNLVLDAGSIQFIGSIGFLAFLGVRRYLGDGRIILCNLSPPVREVFAICKLISTDGTKAPFEVAATLDSAVGRLATRL